MFKKSYLISMLLVAMLVLAACGSTTENQTGVNEDNDNEQEVNEEIETDGEGTTEEDENNTEDESNNEEDVTNDSDGSEDSEASNEEESDDFSANAKQVDSDAQDFTMQILSNYSLTSEEPGRDSLYLTDDGNIFMRIETAPSDDEAYDYFKENTISLLEATSVDGNLPTELTDENMLPQGQDIEKAVGYTSDTPEGVSSGIIFERNGLVVRLTTFDNVDNDHFNDFLKMGETITSK